MKRRNKPGVSTEHCRDDCRKCPHWPDSLICDLILERHNGRMDSYYVRIGECNMCGKCCGQCTYLYSEGDKLLCSIHSNNDKKCTASAEFPTIQDFYDGNVPEGCGFSIKFI